MKLNNTTKQKTISQLGKPEIVETKNHPIKHLTPFIETKSIYPYGVRPYQHGILVEDHKLTYTDGKILLIYSTDTTDLEHGLYILNNSTKQEAFFLYYPFSVYPPEQYPDTSKLEDHHNKAVKNNELKDQINTTLPSRVDYFIHQIYSRSLSPIAIEYLTKMYTLLTDINATEYTIDIPKQPKKSYKLTATAGKERTITIHIMPLIKQ